MNFTQFILKLDNGKTPRGKTVDFDAPRIRDGHGYPMYRMRPHTDEEHAIDIADSFIRGGLGREEFPACCGITCIIGLQGADDLGILCALQKARRDGYTVAMATDIARRDSKAVLLRNGFKITKIFTNRRTGNRLNVYEIDLYPAPNYAEVYKRLAAERGEEHK